MDKTKLQGRDYEVHVDASGSMGAPMKSGKSRFLHCGEQAENVARVANSFDPDGITVGVFGGKISIFENQTPEKVKQIFKENSPNGGTPTDQLLKQRFDAYKSRKAAGNAKPLSMIIFTDGEPTNPDQVVKEIVEFTKFLGKEGGEEVAISFCQVGDDAGATKFLERLDNDLEKEGAVCDIVDCKTEDEVNNLSNVEELLLAGIED